MQETKKIYLRDENGDWEIFVPKRATEKQIQKIIAEQISDCFTDIERTIWVDGFWGFSPGRLDHAFEVEIDPTPPACTKSKHFFHSPHSIVGGIEENPGVWGHGGGVIILEVCKHCGLEKHTDTWAQNPQNGQQGLTSIRYTQSDL